MHIVLYHPQIPQNTGNIVRTCAVTGAKLSLVKPLGFDTSSKALRRAGLDYWLGAEVEEIDSLEAFIENFESDFYFFSSKAERSYADINYGIDDALIFGSETSGLPDWIWERYPERCVTFPMLEGARCLNLSNCAAIASYELLRQHNFPSMKATQKA